jgi:hypothetical protein
MDRPVIRRRWLAAMALVACAAGLAGGCSGGGAKPASAGAGDATAGGGGGALAAHPAGASTEAKVLGANFGDGVGNKRRLRVVRLEIYRLKVPHGAISRSEEFWKHLDEQQVDVGTYDLLRKNGWRLGTAPSEEWPYFRDIIDAHPASSQPFALDADPLGGGSGMELVMKENVDEQNIFYFNDATHLWGYSFGRADNLLSISLQQAPRKTGEARVTVCPTVRLHRKRFEVTHRGGEDREIRRVQPERLYDLNLRADIPNGDFLVIAPSPEVKWRTSLGAAFLIEDGAAERIEHVLLLVPRVEELVETTKPVTPADRSAE